MPDDIEFAVTIRIVDRAELVQTAVDRGLDDKGALGRAIVMTVCNPATAPLETGFELISTVPSNETDGLTTIKFQATALDPAAIIGEARECYAAAWMDTDWTPPSIEEALYEILVASNANGSPVDHGFEIVDFVPATSTPSPSPAPSA